MNEILSNSDLYEGFLEVLQVFDDQIIGVNAASSSSIGSRADYQVLTKRHKEALPLSAYGDGMKRAILLHTAMRMNVQVFMTSHSKEAIEKVLNLGGDIQEQINLYTLQV